MADLTISPDQLKRAITDGFISAMRQHGGSGSGASAGSSQTITRSAHDTARGFKESVQIVQESTKSLAAELAKSGKSFADHTHRVAHLGKLTEFTTNTNLDKITSIISKSSNVVGSANAEMIRVTNEIAAQIEGLGEVDVQTLIDELTAMGSAIDKSKKDLAKFGGSFENLTGALDRSDDKFDAMIISASRFKNTLSDADKAILADVESGKQISKAQAEQLAKATKAVIVASDKRLEQIEKEIRDEMRRNAMKQKATDAYLKMFNIQKLEFSALFLALGAAAFGLWQQFRAIAAAGMAGHFKEIVTSSIKLGISSEKLTEMFKQNSMTLLQAGSKDFVDRINRAQNGLVELGLGLEEAANAANGFHKNAISAGVDPKNTNAINKSMAEQTAAFAKLRAVTGVTAEEFNSLNAQILSNVENQTLSLRLAPEERHARFQELVGLQQEFAQRGLNAQAANQMMQAMQSFSKNKLKDRLEGAARMQQLGGMLGMGAEGARAGELMRKRNLSGSEKAELASISGNLKGALEQFGNQGMGFENAADVMEDNMGNAAKGLLDASVQLKLASDSMMGIKDGEVDKAVDASKLNPNTQAVIKAQDIATNALKTPLWLLVGSVGGILAMMIKSSKFGSMMDILKNKASGARSKVAGAGSKVGTAIKDGFTFLVDKMKNIGMPRLTPSFGGSGVMSSMKGLFTTLMSGVTKAGGVIKTVFGSIRTFLGVVSKAIVPIGIVVSLVTSLYEIFTKFGESLHFDSLGATLMSLGGILMNAVKVFFVDGVSLIGDVILGGISWIVKGLFGPLDEALANAKDQWKNWGADIDKWWNGFMGGFLSYFRSDEEKAKTAKEVKKANDEVDASLKKSTKSTVEQTKALENKVSTEKYLGMSGGFDSVSSASLVNDIQKTKVEEAKPVPDARTKINDAPVNGANDKKSTINKETSGTSPTSGTVTPSTEAGTVTTTTPTNITLADVHKVLLELLNETVTGTDEIVDGLVKLKPAGSKFTQPSRTLMVQT